MSQRVQRDFRKATKDAVKAVAPGIEAAIQNEQLTRQRVEALEEGIRGLAVNADSTAEILTRTFVGRLRWLLTGR